MNSPACRILDLAEVLIEASGKKNVRIVEIGARAGEKLHEVLISDYEKEHTVIDHENYIIVLPTIDLPGLKQFYSHAKPAKMENFSSTDFLMTKEEIKQMLVESGFLK
jgi:UDP-N-acetylglucosamine 4,6-dehydratase/5-epimerase